MWPSLAAEKVTVVGENCGFHSWVGRRCNWAEPARQVRPKIKIRLNIDFIRLSLLFSFYNKDEDEAGWWGRASSGNLTSSRTCSSFFSRDLSPGRLLCVQHCARWLAGAPSPVSSSRRKLDCEAEPDSGCPPPNPAWSDFSLFLWFLLWFQSPLPQPRQLPLPPYVLILNSCVHSFIKRIFVYVLFAIK